MTDLQWAEWLRASGGTGAVFLGIFVIGLIRKWWVIGWIYIEKCEENRELKIIAMRATGNTGQSLETAQRAMEAPR